jgi:ribosome biogenesis GTPase
MPQEQALIIATFSRRMRLRLSSGLEVDARIKGKRIKPVCGDRVLAESLQDESDWLITEILPRDNSLNRPNMRGQTEILAANVDLLIVVAAASPEPDWYIVDRYLCAAEAMRISAAVVFNKTDLLQTGDEFDAALDEYKQIDYAVVRCSAETGQGMQAVESAIEQRTAIIVGQSGVGKSSIINRLLGAEPQRTAAISSKTGEGRHTTVNSEMLTLPGGGYVIDSPGVRDYAPALQSATDVIQGFQEIEAAGHDCRFANCKHLREPGCAVKDAVDRGMISPRRYESYRRLLALTEKLENKL